MHWSTYFQYTSSAVKIGKVSLLLRRMTTISGSILFDVLRIKTEIINNHDFVEVMVKTVVSPSCQTLNFTDYIEPNHNGHVPSIIQTRPRAEDTPYQDFRLK